MSRAIVTRYHGPAGRLGSRISATSEGGRVFRGYDAALGADENHAQAALDLMEKQGLLHHARGLRLVGGAALPGGKGARVFLAVPAAEG